MRFVLVAFALAAGCHARPVAPEPPTITCPGDPRCDDATVGQSVLNKVDVLFVLDDAPSMSVKLAALESALPSFLATLAGGSMPVSYHWGVVTTDLGAGPQTLPSFGCRPGGDGAKLRDAGGSGGVRYIDDNQLTGTSNVADVAGALAALVDVPATGCEFRQPLEAAYRALRSDVPENAGFLRSDALLVVLFLSDADDCSTPPTTDLFDPAATQYGTLDRFRCTQFGIACNGTPVPPMPISGLSGCTSQTMADGGKLFDVDRYLNFFNKPAAQGGVKVDPNHVILAAIAAPSDPVGVSITSPCAGDAGVAMCPTLNRSCISVSDQRFAGDPAVRLNSVVSAARNDNLASVCNGDDTAPLDAVARMILAQTTMGCLPTPVTTRVDGTPDCIVDDVTSNPDGSTTVTDLPWCTLNGHTPPCWQLEDRLAEYDAEGCTAPPAPPAATCKLPASCQPLVVAGTRQLYSITVDRGGAPTPVGTGTNITCAK